MVNTKYSEAAVDVLDILEHMEEEDQKKVPKKFIEILKENASKEYVCNLDYSKRLVEMAKASIFFEIEATKFKNCPSFT